MSTERPDHGDVTHSDRNTAVPRRRRSPLAVASVAAAVLLAGGGGAYFATTAAGGEDRDRAADSGAPSDDSGAPPPLALDGYRQSGSKSYGIAPGEPDPNGAHYHAEGKLPDGPGSAPVYRADGDVTSDEVSRLAKALGLDGTPELTGGDWRVGPDKDGSGPALRVTKQAPGTWTFSRSAPGGTDNCPRGKQCSGTGTPGVGGGAGDAVSEKEAESAAAPVLKALGQDDAKIDADQLMGAVRVVNADPEVGGLPTHGWSTGIRVGADGQVVGGNGRVKAPVKGAEYPVLSADRTLAELNKSWHGGMAPGDCADPVPLAKQSGETARCGPAAGAGKRAEASVRGAVFGLALHFTAGRPALVPSWFFEVRTEGATLSRTVTHPAVDPEYLSDGGAGDPGTSRRGVRITSYNADGASLTVRFWGGVCSDYSASAAESEDKVTVTVTEHKADSRKVCVAIAKEIVRTVRLDAPVGARKVVDSTGATVRQH